MTSASKKDTYHRPIESSQKPGNRDRCENAYADPKQTAAAPKNCQVDEEGDGDVPRGDVRALVDRQPFTQRRLDTPPFHQDRRRTNPTGVPFGPRRTDRDQREAYHPPKLHCHLCHRHLDDVEYAEEDILLDVHIIKKAVSDLQMDVKNLPYPVDTQCDAISNFVKQIAKEHGLTREEVQLRRRIAEDLEAHIMATLPDVKLMLHGSSVNGFCLETSKVDMDLSSVGKADAVKLFIETGDLVFEPKFVKPGPPIPQRILAELDLCSMGDFQYSFTRETLARGKVPPLVCSFCQKSGNLRKHCPDQRLTELKKLPDMTRSFTKPQEEADRQDVLQKLQSLIRESHKDAKLTLYGSSCNGFGLARCDLDIWLTVNSSTDGKDISHVRMIKYLARKFCKHPE
ncbi:hypothetical protein HPB48_003725 [Haemaphysalis longicornis]|uniref:Uncharacterized protein n=1 Tax=Haemaphysalis longicornis TaxID=44386 RepID=A0A9J6FFK5_HAELO|nr:hypothetical protein HPB48_003725 [Haemaphysalis longicornis]